VGLAPGQTDQSGCPPSRTDFRCPRDGVCLYLENGTQVAVYCSGQTQEVRGSSCSRQCPGLLAGLVEGLQALDASSCLARPAMPCALEPGLSEQDIVSGWLFLDVAGACPGFNENTVVVSFEGGCATEMGFARFVSPETAACLASAASAVRWTCHDLSCASAEKSTLAAGPPARAP